MPAEAVADPRSAMQVTQRIVGNLEQIVRGELRLLQAQLVEEVRTLAGTSVFLLLGAGLAQLAAGCLVLGAIYLLGTRLPLWGAALTIGGVCAVASGAMLRAGQLRITRLATEKAQAFEARMKEGTWAGKLHG
jgi:uncharacterized membrane protein YqjE